MPGAIATIFGGLLPHAAHALTIWLCAIGALAPNVKPMPCSDYLPPPAIADMTRGRPNDLSVLARTLSELQRYTSRERESLSFVRI